jgi:hypothetical protein
MLSERSISDVKASWPEHWHIYAEAPNRYFEAQLPEAALSQLLSRLGELDALPDQERTCALFGFGSQTRGLYRTLGATPGLEVIWRGDFGPWWLRPMGLIGAAHGGLIRVGDAKAVPDAVRTLARLAMVEVYSFRSELWSQVEDYVLAATWRSFIGSLLAREDRSYFCFGVDGDSPDTDAYTVWSSFGAECPENLQRIAGIEHGV